MKNYDDMYAMKSVSDFVFMSPSIEEKLLALVSGDQPFPVAGKNGILLWGTVGTGKTELAKLLPNSLEARFRGNEVNASFWRISQGGANGADVISKILTAAQLVPQDVWNNYFVLDEVDRLRPDSMESLRSVMGYQDTVFIFTTNHRNKIEASVISRCHSIECNAAPDNQWLPVVKNILSNEGVANIYSDAVLLKVISACDGCARDILSNTYGLAVRAQKLLANKAA